MAAIPEFTDILFEVKGRAAWITINRPKVYNAFRGHSLDEIIQALHLAANDKGVASIGRTGCGGKAFCTGGDQSDQGGPQSVGVGVGVVILPWPQVCPRGRRRPFFLLRRHLPDEIEDSLP